MRIDVRSSRPGQSEATAEAQLAMADAAFHLGFLVGDEEWLNFGLSLVTNTLRRFRLPEPAAACPRDCEYPVHKVQRILGLKFWPDPNFYSAGCNARAYLLLKRLNAPVFRRSRAAEWRAELAQALVEQEDFLRRQVLPEVERTGVVPSGLFEIQDLDQQSSALAVHRWTTTEDWLWFLEAALDLGVSPATCRGWLDNLARVHGTRWDRCGGWTGPGPAAGGCRIGRHDGAIHAGRSAVGACPGSGVCSAET